jgi:hypothetical protein
MIKCSMAQNTILMGVLLMILNKFCNIWIFVQVFHGKLGDAPSFFLFEMPRITIVIL